MALIVATIGRDDSMLIVMPNSSHMVPRDEAAPVIGATRRHPERRRARRIWAAYRPEAETTCTSRSPVMPSSVTAASESSSPPIDFTG
jgi:hypothetical protein